MIFLTDLDGCLTDGCYYMFSDLPGIIKRFNTCDFHGMMLLSQKEVGIGIITLSQGKVIEKQVDRLIGLIPIHLFAGVHDKKALVQDRYIDTGHAKWEEIAYIGDDENDLGLLEVAGMAACPRDAQTVVLNMINKHENGFVMERKGGEGCVREFADMVSLIV